MIVYRLEHEITGLGPFQHDHQIAEVINKGIHANTKAMLDVDHYPQVAKMLRRFHGRVRFAFTTKVALAKMIKDSKVLEKHGFACYVIELIGNDYFISPCGQVVYCVSDELRRQQLFVW